MKNTIVFLCISLCFFGYSQEVILTKSKLDSLANSGTDELPLSELPFTVIENVPVYKGCEKKESNAAKKKCMSQNIAMLFKENFNTELHEYSDLEPGKKRISIIFRIDKEGHVIDIKAYAADEFLIAEAIRVTKLIPQLTPGYQKGKPVIVPYSLPLIVNLEPNKNKQTSRYPVFRGCDKTANNEDLEACSKQKITNFIKMSFDIEMASRVLPLEKSTQFLVEFTINKKGKIQNVNAKANHKAIAIEAIKVAKRIPKFKAPGYDNNGDPIETPYKLLMTLYF